jgi:hypothetical protein
LQSEGAAAAEFAESGEYVFEAVDTEPEVFVSVGLVRFDNGESTWNREAAVDRARAARCS